MGIAKYYNYYGFLSHRRADDKPAGEIKHLLESFRIPKQIIIENNYPSKFIRNIFLDKEDMRSAELSGHLVDILKQSRKLIVVCSKDCASNPKNESGEWTDPEHIRWMEAPDKNGWIGFEILHFINRERTDHPFNTIDELRQYLEENKLAILNDDSLNPFKDIVPVVVGGNTKIRDCFHPVLKIAVDLGFLRYIDISPEGLKKNKENKKRHRRDAFLDIVISVLSPSNVDDFKRRYKIQKTVKLCSRIGAALIFISLISFLYYYFVPHTAYYQDYRLKWELPVGINKISLRDASELDEYYKIVTTKYKHTIRFEHLNSYGVPTETNEYTHPDGPSIAIYKCRDNWKPDTVEYLDRNGIVQMTYAYATDMDHVTFQENDFVSQQVYPIAEINEYGIPNRMKIDTYQLILDDDGSLLKRMYKSGVNFVIDENGVAGEEFRYDDEGRLTEVFYLNSDEERTSDQDGISGIMLEYSERGILTSYSYTDVDSEPVYCKDGFSYFEVRRKGSTEYQEFYDIEGNLINNSEGYAVLKTEYDRKAHTIVQEFYDQNNEVAFCDRGYHKLIIKQNDKGDIDEVTYYNDSDKLIQCKSGFAKIVMEHDENGNETKRIYYGSDDQALLLSDNVCKTERTFSNDGYLISEEYFGINGKPTYSSKGYSKFVNTYDEKNRLIETEYFALDGEKGYAKGGYHKILFKYDDKRSNLLRVSLYNAADTLVSYDGYWAEQAFKYNGGGQVEEIEYFDPFGKYVNITGNYAHLVNTYDDTGLLTSTAYYDKKGNLVTNYSINDYGVRIGNRFYAKIVFEYDEAGRVINTKYLDTNEELTHDYQYAESIQKYDEVGHEIEKTLKDADGIIYMNSVSQYDDFGHLIKQNYYSEDKTPVEILTKSLNAHEIQIKRDAKGNVIDRIYLNKNKEQIEHVKFVYDDNGLQISESYYDTSESLTIGSQGYAIKKTEYSELNEVLRESYYDENESLLELSRGYAICEYEYNDDGVKVGSAFYDKNREPVNLTNFGYSSFRETVNQRRCTEEGTFYDKDNNPIFTYKVEYDNSGLPTKQILLNGKGEPMGDLRCDVAEKRMYYDERGKEIREEYYGTDLKPKLISGVLSGWIAEYDEKGYEISRTYLGEEFTPSDLAYGFATVTTEYDDLGNVVKRVFYDEDMKEVNTKFGFSRYEVKYDSEQNITDEIFYDSNGDKLTDVDGHLTSVWLNFHDGNIELKSYSFDSASGNIVETAVASNTINVYRTAFESNDGEYDVLMLPYVPLFNPTVDVNELIAKLSISGENIEVQPDDVEVTVDADISKLLDEYVACIASSDDSKLNELLLDLYDETSSYVKESLDIDVEGQAIRDCYQSFYKTEMEELTAVLVNEYGEYDIAYEVKGIQQFDDNMLSGIKTSYQTIGFDSESIEAYAVLEVEYTVNGNVRTDSYFCSVVTVMKVNGEWKLLAANGFPEPDQETLKELYGL